jgi:hypothetical protein
MEQADDDDRRVSWNPLVVALPTPSKQLIAALIGDRRTRLGDPLRHTKCVLTGFASRIRGRMPITSFTIARRCGIAHVHTSLFDLLWAAHGNRIKHRVAVASKPEGGHSSSRATPGQSHGLALAITPLTSALDLRRRLRQPLLRIRTQKRFMISCGLIQHLSPTLVCMRRLGRYPPEPP